MEKPLPDTVTAVPTGPELGVSVIEGGETVKDVKAKSPELPVTVIV